MNIAYEFGTQNIVHIDATPDDRIEDIAKYTHYTANELVEIINCIIDKDRQRNKSKDELLGEFEQ